MLDHQDPRRWYSRMGRRMLDEGLAYERTEGVAVPGSWHWPFPEGTCQQHACKRVPSKETHTKPSSSTGRDMGSYRGGTNECQNLQSQVIQGLGEPNTAVLKAQQKWHSREDILEGQVKNIQLYWCLSSLFWLLASSLRRDIRP